MARVLAASFGRDVPSDLLIGILWPGPEGGPRSARDGLSVYAYQLRKLLAPFGLAITGTGRGSRYRGSYRMHRTTAA
jgi:hypothetical protein